MNPDFSFEDKIKKGIRTVWQEIGTQKEIALAIAGGGIKAFYGLGFAFALRTWGIRIKEVSGVSAGAAMAVSTLSETEVDSSNYFQELTKRNPKNFYWNRLLRILSPFPHHTIARRTVNYCLRFPKLISKAAKIRIHTVEIPKETLDKNRKGEPIQRLLLAKAASIIRAYFQDEELRKKGNLPHRVLKKMKDWGWRERIFTEEDFKDPETAAQIVMNSCSAFPVLPLQSLNGNYYLDGGLTNNLLLEKFSPELPKIGVFYESTTLVGKSPEILRDTLLISPEGKFIDQGFDYTSPQLVQYAFELGKKDAEAQKDKILTHLFPNWKKNLHSFFEQIK
ncbi:patatin-like phospholipase family protein [Leptospira wolffii]|uniref:Patatin-like phospholipase family protein n=1 Tax=Leptospira wolffii TaxID=409998 RepID=A0ABV5BL89_9LEPT|nr:patatin-like phospholipase family protein [Leptospira wolffii]TGK59952.1 patatin-like phospholipase family protein [Leptospira wolffii]TGK67592.1 patatin-like phospholipase family protein [Leptospira wolffii]TGK75960.1 patatin-like phospholipase family protein [Leptospira wolffii]TGL30211.1 patatin-like phospholipase family protein [Leptospira wolffii]TGL46344.1 patatin-like phospholipase family protein [Leptospira wolffii]